MDCSDMTQALFFFLEGGEGKKAGLVSTVQSSGTW